MKNSSLWLKITESPSFWDWRTNKCTNRYCRKLKMSLGSGRGSSKITLLARRRSIWGESCPVWGASLPVKEATANKAQGNSLKALQKKSLRKSRRIKLNRLIFWILSLSHPKNNWVWSYPNNLRNNLTFSTYDAYTILFHKFKCIIN